MASKDHEHLEETTDVSSLGDDLRVYCGNLLEENLMKKNMNERITK